MKFKSFFQFALLAVGCGIGFSASAMTLSECCRIYQQECELNYGAPACAGLYDSCMKSRRCILN